MADEKELRRAIWDKEREERVEYLLSPASSLRIAPIEAVFFFNKLGKYPEEHPVV